MEQPRLSRRGHTLLILFLAGFFAAWTLRATVFYAIDERIDSPAWRAAYAALLKLALWVVPAFAYSLWVRPRTPTRLLGMSTWPDPRGWVWSLGLIAAFLSVVAAFETVSGRRSWSAAGWASLPLVLLILQFVVSPLFEELFFRGLVMAELLRRMPASLASGVTSLLFVGVHLPFWLSHGGLSNAMLANALGVFLFSLVACALFARTASVWPAALAHVANNLLSSSLRP